MSIIVSCIYCSFVWIRCTNLNLLICIDAHSHIFLQIYIHNWISLNQDMNESIPEDDDHNIQYPLYYDGTTSHDYEMACFVLSNKTVTIQEMNAVYS